MNRLVVASILGVIGSFAFGCSPVAVGDPCIPEIEFSASSGAANQDDLTIDVKSVQCETRVCLQHYFKGRVSCPYGNGGKGGTQQCVDPKADPKTCDKKKCRQVGDHRNVYTIDGVAVGDGGELCCPILGDPNEGAIANPVSGQCSKRPASQAVYCSCRCDVPNDPDIDRNQVQLCKCPSGFTCKPLCDSQNGNCGVVPKGKWGSYCVKDGPLGAGYDPDKNKDSLCGADLVPPAGS
jgi:hypothetical protein